jgi:hypothetical protein
MYLAAGRLQINELSNNELPARSQVFSARR